MVSSIGTRIKKLRKKKNISQEKLANDLLISRQTISKWESDIVSPDIKNIEIISKYFEVSADYLINGEKEKIIIKQSNICIILCFIIGMITIIITSILMIINKGKDSPSSTINFSYEFVLMIIGLLVIVIPIIYLFKKKK